MTHDARPFAACAAQLGPVQGQQGEVRRADDVGRALLHVGHRPQQLRHQRRRGGADRAGDRVGQRRHHQRAPARGTRRRAGRKRKGRASGLGWHATSGRWVGVGPGWRNVPASGNSLGNGGGRMHQYIMCSHHITVWHTIPSPVNMGCVRQATATLQAFLAMTCCSTTTRAPTCWPHGGRRCDAHAHVVCSFGGVGGVGPAPICGCSTTVAAGGPPLTAMQQHAEALQAAFAWRHDGSACSAPASAVARRHVPLNLPHMQQHVTITWLGIACLGPAGV